MPWLLVKGIFDIIRIGKVGVEERFTSRLYCWHSGFGIHVSSVDKILMNGRNNVHCCMYTMYVCGLICVWPSSLDPYKLIWISDPFILFSFELCERGWD